MPSWVWPASLSTVSPRPARAAAGRRMPDLFRAGPCPTVWKYLRPLPPAPGASPRLGCRGAGCAVCTQRVFPWGRHLGVQLLGQVAAAASPSEGLGRQTASHGGCTSDVPTAAREAHFSTSSSALALVRPRGRGRVCLCRLCACRSAGRAGRGARGGSRSGGPRRRPERARRPGRGAGLSRDAETQRPGWHVTRGSGAGAAGALEVGQTPQAWWPFWGLGSATASAAEGAEGPGRAALAVSLTGLAQAGGRTWASMPLVLGPDL